MAKSKKKGSVPVGSPGKYRTHVQPYIKRIASWVERGATEKEVASKLGVAVSTFAKYLALGRRGEAPYEELAIAFTRACAEPDDTVEAALFRRACGYQFTEVTLEEKLDRDGCVHCLRKEVTRDVAPDPTSAMFWLTNRQPDRWKYRKTKEDQTSEEEEKGGVVMLAPATKLDPHPPDEEAKLNE